VMRGASFNNGGRGGIYSAKRDRHVPGERKVNYGFRVVLAEGPAPQPAARRLSWRPVPFKLNAKIEGGFVHLVKYDYWAGPKLQITNGAVRAVIGWQPEAKGSNDYIKVTTRLKDNEHY